MCLECKDSEVLLKRVYSLNLLKALSSQIHPVRHLLSVRFFLSEDPICLRRSIHDVLFTLFSPRMKMSPTYNGNTSVIQQNIYETGTLKRRGYETA